METETSNANYLETISILHYVLAVLIYFKGLIAPFIIGIAAVALSHSPHDTNLFVLFLTFFAALLLILPLTCIFGTLVLLAGRYISTRKYLVYCQIIAGLECLCVPLGTILGIFTLIQLTKPTVKATFK
ncbi:MAG TPA: hypothetical protein PK052_05995 [Anaerohalosphaeraceae bacterium]|nr:hypothetical protein [Phycisphaerae bacterium]HOK94582.1 hypothetical protein [Anaerohalosphaeraceae bacterium]HOL31519.1 hypothetical protein [Anaerohalosphaeraceae bacterium]HOM75558.1 hypothetical protein [Anaerohalosphaeraceae bacterium]HPC64340.1 hypothetical protein [Anaerohalosphaeraceae bacterium]